MILQALTELYNALENKGILASDGWKSENISFALAINEEGDLLRVVDLRTQVENDKGKIRLAKRVLNVPERKGKTSNVSANFLVDNGTYFLGLDVKGKPERTLQCFEASKSLHQTLLANATSPMSMGIKSFFQKWDPNSAHTHPMISPYIKEITDGANFIFMQSDQFAIDDPQIREAWDSSRSDSDAPIMQCLVTGKKAPIAVIHPEIRGIRGAKSTGAKLVSFNTRAFESYGQESGQGRNAPVSKKATFAYGAALQWLVNDPSHHYQLGDMTVVYWAEDINDTAQDFLGNLFDQDNTVDVEMLKRAVFALANGTEANWNNIPIKPTNHFYVLGLSPNVSRLSVRFFLIDTFGHLAHNMQDYYDELQIEHRPEEPDVIPMWKLLQATVNMKSKNKKPSPHLAGDMLRAITTHTRYPESLLDLIEIRIRAESGNDKISYARAALIKAYLLRNCDYMPDQAKEGINAMELNENTNYAPYLLGRVFAVLETIQYAANPRINTTIRDRFFNSACCTPAIIFPRLINLAQAHLKKLESNIAAYYNKQLTDLLSRIEDTYPARLNLQDQGVFQLGYYHQTKARYTKKESTN